MKPILGRYGPYFLTSYFVILGLGVLAAITLTAIIARRQRLSGWVDGVWIAGGVALVAGRIIFVWLNQDFFRENPGQAWAVWQGGLNPYAALIAGLLSYYAWLLITRRPRGTYLDLIAPGLAVLAAAGWAACWFEGCTYGREITPGLFAADLPDNFGVFAVRYQTQAIGFLLAALIAAISAWWSMRQSPDAAHTGALFWLTLAALGASWAVVAPLRGDPTPVWLGLRADLLVDLTLLAFSIAAASYVGARHILARGD